MSVFLRQRPGWQFPRAVRGEGALIWDELARQPPLTIEPDQVDEAVAILGDAITAVTRDR